MVGLENARLQTQDNYAASFTYHYRQLMCRSLIFAQHLSMTQMPAY